METLEQLRHQIQSVQEMHSVVGTMKALAAVNIQQYEQAVTALADYNHTVELGLQVALNAVEYDFTPEEDLSGELGAIIIGSDQGLVGQFNRLVVQHAIETMNGWQKEHPKRRILAVGSRVAVNLSQQEHPMEDVLRMPSSISGITPLVQELLLRINNWQDNLGIDRIVLFYNNYQSRSSYEPVTHTLTPIDPDWLEELQARPWKTRAVPFYRLEWRQMFAALLREHFFVTIFLSLAESLASENASRLSSMQVAESNIEDHLDELNQQYHHMRQSSITQELMDVISGYEAIQG